MMRSEKPKSKNGNECKFRFLVSYWIDGFLHQSLLVYLQLCENVVLEYIDNSCYTGLLSLQYGITIHPFLYLLRYTHRFIVGTFVKMYPFMSLFI